MREQEILAAFFKTSFNLADPFLGDELGYPILPLCVIDAVFSIGVHYNSTKKVIKRFEKMFCNERGSIPGKDGSQLTPAFTISDLISLYKKYGIEEMADEVYKNRHRTSPINGILKAEAVLKFSNVLVNFGVDRMEDVGKIIGNYDFEMEIKQIPGQRSGVSLKYFYILAGLKDYVVPGRMVKRFVEEILGRKVKEHEFQPLIFGASLILEKEYPGIRACILDHLIWKYQREFGN